MGVFIGMFLSELDWPLLAVSRVFFGTTEDVSAFGLECTVFREGIGGESESVLVEFWDKYLRLKRSWMMFSSSSSLSRMYLHLVKCKSESEEDTKLTISRLRSSSKVC